MNSRMFDSSFETLDRLKVELKREDEELRQMLNKEHIDYFELDSFMNQE